MALRKVGVIFTAEGYSQYMGELKQVNQEMRTMATQSKLAVAQLGNNASTTDTYKTKMKSMGDEIKVSGQRTKMLTDLQKTLGAEQKRLPGMIEETNKKYKESTKTTKDLKKSYEDLAKAKGEDAEETLAAEKAYKSSVRETNNLKKEMKELEVVYSQNSKQLEKLPNDLAKAELATQKLTNAQQKLHTEYRNQGGWLADTAKKWDDFGNTAISTGDNLQKAGGYMTSRFTVPILAGYTAATKVASEFHTQIGQLGPLLAEGGNITEEHRKQMDLLGESSRSWAIDYGKNTSEINNGMAELVRNGYDTSQVMGMIPNLLDASIASGEDFNAVMHTSANVLSQFDLRGKDTNETLANTQRVVDSLTYVANATSSGFGDLGAGMAYIGPVANTLNMSIEETASLLGILSDNGIEASQGGTALRGALTRLLKPSKQNAVAMEELGINVEDYKNGLLDFPTILDTIAENTKNLTDEQKAALIAQAFGTESQSAMNALVSAGGDELRNMTNEARNASGATKEIADAMKELPEFKFQQMWAKVRDLGIEVGTQLLPHVLTAVDAIGDWVSAFSDLDESTQGFIIKAGLAVAVIGPLATGLGSIAKIAGYTSKGISGIIRTIGKWTTPKSIGETATELGKIPGAATNAGGAAALFSNPWVIAGGVVTGVIAGIGLLIKSDADAPHKAHQESVKETQGAYQAWFDAVTSGAGEAAAAQTALQDATERTGESYKEQADRILNQNKVIQDNIDTIFQGGFYDAAWAYQLGGYGTGLTSYESLEGQLKNMLPKGQIAEIESDFNGLAVMVGNTMADIGNNFKEQNVVTATWAKGKVDGLATVKAATIENLTAQKNSWLEQAQSESEYHSNSTQWLKERTAEIETEYNRQVAVVERAQDTVYSILTEASAKGRALTETEMVSISRSIMDMAKVSGQSLSELVQAGEVTGEALRAMVTDTGLAFMEAEGMIDKSTADMVRSIKDPGERVAAFMKALEEYDQIKPDKKHLDVDTSDIEVALLSIEELANAWADLTFEERLAQVETRGKEEIEDLMQRLGVDWESLSPSQKEYYAQAEGGEALENILYLTGEWDRSTDPKTKYAILETQIDNEALLGAIEMRDLWNNADFMSLAMEIDTNAPDAKEQLANLVNYFIAQEGLAPLQMETEALTEESQQKLADLIATYTGAPVEDVLEFLTSTNADETEAKIGAATEAHEEAGGVGTANLPTSTNADETTGKINNTSTALSNLNGKSASVAVYLADNASFVIQRISEQLSGLDGRTATAYVTTKTATATFAEGGHITPFATGGHVMPMFATGGHIVPNNFQGIVGEAGPEIFTVSSRGVSITPLNSKEKMRGVQGAVADEVSKQLKGGSGGDTININITGPTFRDEVDMDKLVTKINKVLGTQVHNKKRGRPA